MRAFLGHLDRRAFRAMRTRLHTPALECAAVAYTTLGRQGALWSALALLGAARDRERRPEWLRAAAVPPAAIAVNWTIKEVIRRERPLLDGHPPLVRAPRSLSFPSGHAAAAFAGAVAIGRLRPRARAPLLGAAALMAATRPYLGVHFPADAVAGAALGAAFGAVAGPPRRAPGPAGEARIPWPETAGAWGPAAP